MLFDEIKFSHGRHVYRYREAVTPGGPFNLIFASKVKKAWQNLVELRTFLIIWTLEWAFPWVFLFLVNKAKGSQKSSRDGAEQIPPIKILLVGKNSCVIIAKNLTYIAKLSHLWTQKGPTKATTRVKMGGKHSPKIYVPSSGQT